VSALPDWLDPLPDAEQMRATDRWAIEEQRVPSLDLMERAGTGLARLAADVAPQGAVVVVCGKGNNGGDGLVAARLLRDAERDVRVLAVGDLSELRGDARANLQRLPGDPPAAFGLAGLDGAACVVDAVLGTGFAGEPRGPVGGALEALSACPAPVVAADVPSGVDASTGEVAGAAVRATATATFAAAKPGLWIAPGKDHAGAVRVVDIGIPAGAPVQADVGLIRDAVLDLIPRRGRGSTKFTSGHVLVAGGARGLTGAVCLAAEAAMRAGAGYVTACVPASLEAIFESRLLEVMTRALPDTGGGHTGSGATAVLDEAQRRGGALVLGPGLSRAPGAVDFARRLAAEATVPLVVDADGLNAHQGAVVAFAARSAPTVLTPHAGELGRLLGVESSVVQARRLHHAREAARQAAAIVVLKGDDTLVAAPDGRVAVSPGATAALATAGTGDVLSGVIGALLAKDMDPFAAASAGVRLHARAGLRAAELQGADGVIASDVIAALPRALAR
jgi:ADP-dependent NAD(P)H-hydrate dehydratase / NAD(P)H-hydrate epimerase